MPEHATDKWLVLAGGLSGTASSEAHDLLATSAVARRSPSVLNRTDLRLEATDVVPHSHSRHQELAGEWRLHPNLP
jgi:hypothetical protein